MVLLNRSRLIDGVFSGFIHISLQRLTDKDENLGERWLVNVSLTYLDSNTCPSLAIDHSAVVRIVRWNTVKYLCEKSDEYEP